MIKKFICILFIFGIIFISGCVQVKKPTCGNRIIEEGETIENCCEDVGCLGDQICENHQCIGPTCSECQYIENYECKNYLCCSDSDCNDNNESTRDRCINPSTLTAQCENKETPKECYDGTPLGTCSANKPEYCTSEGELIENCEKCGCPNLMYCEDNNCKKKVISEPIYDCTLCHGFCYVNDENTESICTEDGKYFEWPKDDLSSGKSCQNDSECWGTQKCIKNYCITDIFNEPWGLPIIIKPIYIRSVTKGSDFELTINIKNIDSKSIQVRVEQVRTGLLTEADDEEDKSLNYQNTKIIPANSEENFVINISAFNKLSAAAEIRFSIRTDRNLTDMNAWEYDIPFGTKRTGPIIVYDSQFAQTCGDLIYDTRNAVCINNVAYPTGSGSACYANSDCLGRGVCLHYSCISYSSKFNTDGQYKVGIVPVFVYENISWYNSEKDKRINDLNRLAEEASDWFINEREFQNAKNNFSVEYEFYKSCALHKEEMVSALKECEYWGNKCEKKILSRCDVDLNKYDIIAEHGYYQPDMDMVPLYDEWNRMGVFGVSGINFGDIIIFGLIDESGYPDMGVLIHETLHSFGEVDLYMEYGFPNEFYQERNCNLFRANWELFDKVPHLCSWEAKIIGWKD